MAKEWSKQVFSRNLRKYIADSKITQKELADAVGVSAPTLNEWVAGKKFPRIDKVQKLADYFGILKSDLIEEKLTPEKEKDNDLLAEIIVRMRTDEDFRDAVVELYQYDTEKLSSIRRMLQAFAK